ncbi:MAG: OadG family transporter subunit [Lachnospiraceae bacterium]
MKQNIKRILLVLCMITCLFALSACQKSDTTDESALDPQMVSYMSEWASSLLEQLSSMSTQEVEEQILLAEQNKDTVFSEGLKSWLDTSADAGTFESVLSTQVEAADEGFSITVQGQYANRMVEYKVNVDEEGNLQSMSFTPEYTVAEKMAKAAMNTLMGMGTVFVVLIIIICLISCFKYISIFEQKLKNKASAPETAEKMVDMPAVLVEEVQEDVVDELELVAVITAAIAAAEGTSADGLVVRSIKRASASKWKRA